VDFYIATGLDNAEQANTVASELAARGHSLTYDWTAHGSVQGRGDDVMRAVAKKEAQGILDADVLVALLPGGRGTHTEIGIALGACKPVILYVPDPEMVDNNKDTPRTCAFYFHPLVVWAFDLQAVHTAMSMWTAMHRSRFGSDAIHPKLYAKRSKPMLLEDL